MRDSDDGQGKDTARGGHHPVAGTLVLIACAGLVAACERETRDTRLDPPLEAALDDLALMANRIGGTPPEVYFAMGEPYERNAYALAQGKRLYAGFGCRSCHSDGEGGKGPPFLDGWWQYGPDIVSVVSSIRDGRPNGMPAFRETLTTEQIWQLAGYVQTIGAMTAKTAAPGRNDERQTRPAENRAPAADPAHIQPPSR